MMAKEIEYRRELARQAIARHKIEIPDISNGPSLQLLVRKLGEIAADALGEEYLDENLDAETKQAHGGYQYITREMWAEFDAAMRRYRLRVGDRNQGS